MICLQGTELPRFIQFSKENGQKLNKGMGVIFYGDVMVVHFILLHLKFSCSLSAYVVHEI